ncbi:MAG: 30S ribosomal protein S8 [Candidatus Lambdaproteobacteria bacterium]|nr:30S ribosomal protein S8 [Candidatus Lambdaproteobacteria bacterium]
MTDPVADFLTHLRNATMRRHASVDTSSSKLKLEIARVFKEEGFIAGFTAYTNESGKARLAVELKYDEQGDSVIRGVKRISRPGLRRHAGYDEILPVYNGQGIAVVTTSQGVMTDQACRTHQVGGEILCHIW